MFRRKRCKRGEKNSCYRPLPEIIGKGTTPQPHKLTPDIDDLSQRELLDNTNWAWFRSIHSMGITFELPINHR